MRLRLFSAVAGIIALFFLLSFIPHFPPAPETHEIKKIDIGQEELTVLIADTPSLRKKGLSGRSSLGPNEGMLFVFETPDFHSFWMKDMHFSLDIIWIDAEGSIVTILESVSPDSYPRSFTPKRPALFVLELPAGKAKSLGLREGNSLVLP